MRSIVGTVVAALALAGCTQTVEEMSYSERKALAEQIVQRCYAQGVKSGTPEMALCTQAESQREQATRSRKAAVEDARRANRPHTQMCQKFGSNVVCF